MLNAKNKSNSLRLEATPTLAMPLAKIRKNAKRVKSHESTLNQRPQAPKTIYRNNHPDQASLTAAISRLLSQRQQGSPKRATSASE